MPQELIASNRSDEGTIHDGAQQHDAADLLFAAGNGIFPRWLTAPSANLLKRWIKPVS
jgi:hypothetical protein